MNTDKHRLNHEFRTFCGLIGAVRQSAIALRSCFSSEQIPHEYEVQLQVIESNLERLLREFQQQADEYQKGRIPIDLDLADRTYRRGLYEWRGNLDQLLETVAHLMKARPVTENQEVRELLAPLQRLQQGQMNTLKELLEKY